MDQTKRTILFIVLTGLVWFGWFGWVQPRFFPPQAPAKKPAAVVALEDEPEAPAGDDPAAAAGDGDQPAPAAEPETKLVRPDNPKRTILLGSDKPDAGYFQQVSVTTVGAGVEWIALNDPRYRDLAARKEPLKVVGGVPGATVETLETTVPELDGQLAGFGLKSADVAWKVERTEPDPKDAKVNKAVVLSLTAPDGSFEVVKTYSLRRVENSADPAVRDADPKGYMLDVSIAVRNLSDEREAVAYTLQGPVGMPLENEEHTSKYRDLEYGFLEDDGDVRFGSMAVKDVTTQSDAAEVARKAEAESAKAARALRSAERAVADLEAQAKAAPGDKAVAAKLAAARADRDEVRAYAEQAADAAQDAVRGREEWTKPFKYLGVEVQYFVALLFPEEGKRTAAERLKKPWVASAVPEVVSKGTKTEFNDISFRLASTELAVPPGGEVKHSYALYAGPKRRELLLPLGATDVLDLGNMLGPLGRVISRGMLVVLGGIHSLGAPYWLAIICLTVLVRSALFPLSKRQAVLAAKMKEFQPKINELKAKFGNDQEKLLKAQAELFRKHGYGPLGPMVSASGCLPIFLQMPIFIGLYLALQTSIDLRQAEFLWIDNLAAPDRLFRMPISLPFLGQDFNLLPLVTVVLFYVQQKLFMPPATTPEQEAQYKMMNFMMIFMGFFFYHVPAGLCLYFIASSSWSICERKLLANTKAAHISAAESEEIDHEIEEMTGKGPAKGKKPATPAPPRKPSWLERMLIAAEEARKNAELGGDQGRAADKSKPTGPKPKKAGPRR